LSPQKQLNIAGVVHDTIGICYRRLAARKCVAIGATFGHGSEPLAPPHPLDIYPVPTTQYRYLQHHQLSSYVTDRRSRYAVRCHRSQATILGLGIETPGRLASAIPRLRDRRVKVSGRQMERWSIGALERRICRLTDDRD